MIARRTWPVLAAGALILLGIALATPWPLYDAALQDSFSSQIRTMTGLEVEIQAAPKLSLLPRPGIRLRGVVFRTGNDSVRVEAPKATASIRFLSLLDGRFELSSLDLMQPTLFIDMDAVSKQRAGAISRAAEAARNTPDREQADAFRLGSLKIESGLAYLRSKNSHFETLIEDIQAVVSWPRIGAPASLVGHATWRGMSGEVSARVDQPNLLLRGDMSDAALQFNSSSGTFSFEGSVVCGNHPQMSGRLQAALPSLDQLMKTLHVEMPLSGTVQSLTMAGDVRASRQELSLTGVNLTTDGNVFEGSLAMGRSLGRLHLSGTLASDLLTFDPIVAGLSGAAEPASSDENSPDVGRLTQRLASDLSHGDIDLRVSATNVQLAQMKFTDAALSLLSSNGKVEISLAEARGYHGMVKAKVLIGSGPDGLDVRTSGSFAEGDIGSFLTDAFGPSRLVGSGSLVFALETNGRTLAQLRENLDGHGQVGLDQGEVEGVDIEQILRRAERQSPARATGLENRSGRTAFDTARASFAVSKGLLTVDDAVISGPGMAMSLTGAVSMIDGSGKLKAVAARVGDAADSISLTIDITGPWNRPSIRPDFASLLRQPLVHFAPSDLQSPPTNKINE
jgi:AsmA protein